MASLNTGVMLRGIRIANRKLFSMIQLYVQSKGGHFNLNPGLTSPCAQIKKNFAKDSRHQWISSAALFLGTYGMLSSLSAPVRVLLIAVSPQADCLHIVFLEDISLGSKHSREPLLTIESAPAHLILKRILE